MDIRFRIDVKQVILADHLYNEFVYKRIENGRPSGIQFLDTLEDLEL